MNFRFLLIIFSILACCLAQSTQLIANLFHAGKIEELCRLFGDEHMFVCPEGPGTSFYIDCHVPELVFTQRECGFNTACGLSSFGTENPCVYVSTLTAPPGINITNVCVENEARLDITFGFSCIGDTTDDYLQCIGSEATVRECPPGTECFVLGFGAGFPCVSTANFTSCFRRFFFLTFAATQLLKMCAGNTGYACFFNSPNVFLQCAPFIGAVQQCAPGTVCTIPPGNLVMWNPCSSSENPSLPPASTLTTSLSTLHLLNPVTF